MSLEPANSDLACVGGIAVKLTPAVATELVELARAANDVHAVTNAESPHPDHACIP